MVPGTTLSFLFPATRTQYFLFSIVFGACYPTSTLTKAAKDRTEYIHTVHTNPNPTLRQLSVCSPLYLPVSRFYLSKSPIISRAPSLPPSVKMPKTSATYRLSDLETFPTLIRHHLAPCTNATPCIHNAKARKHPRRRIPSMPDTAQHQKQDRK